MGGFRLLGFVGKEIFLLCLDLLFEYFFWFLAGVRCKSLAFPCWFVLTTDVSIPNKLNY